MLTLPREPRNGFKCEIKTDKSKMPFLFLPQARRIPIDLKSWISTTMEKKNFRKSSLKQFSTKQNVKSMSMNGMTLSLPLTKSFPNKLASAWAQTAQCDILTIYADAFAVQIREMALPRGFQRDFEGMG